MQVIKLERDWRRKRIAVIHKGAGLMDLHNCAAVNLADSFFHRKIDRGDVVEKNLHQFVISLGLAAFLSNRMALDRSVRPQHNNYRRAGAAVGSQLASVRRVVATKGLDV